MGRRVLKRRSVFLTLPQLSRNTVLLVVFNLRYGSFIIKCRPPKLVLYDPRLSVIGACALGVGYDDATLVAYRASCVAFSVSTAASRQSGVSQDRAVLTWCIEELVQRDRCTPRELVAYTISEKRSCLCDQLRRFMARLCAVLSSRGKMPASCITGYAAETVRSSKRYTKANFTKEYVTTPDGYNFSLKTRQTCDILLRPTAVQIAELVGLTTAFPGKMLVRGVNSDDDVARRMEACKELLAVMRQEYGWKGFDRRGCFRQSVDNSANLSHWIKKPIT